MAGVTYSSGTAARASGKGIAAVGRRFCGNGHEGVDVNERSTRWIIISTAAALWVTTVLAAHAKVGMHWYLAIWLATALASCAVLACAVDALARRRQARTAAEGVNGGDAQLVCAAIDALGVRMEAISDQHALRVEGAAKRHGDRMQADVLNLRRWEANKYRGRTLGQIDAAIEAERRAGNDTGPFSQLWAGPR